MVRSTSSCTALATREPQRMFLAPHIAIIKGGFEFLCLETIQRLFGRGGGKLKAWLGCGHGLILPIPQPTRFKGGAGNRFGERCGVALGQGLGKQAF